MLLGIFSDVHDNLQNLQKVLTAFKEREIATLIFCGDFCSPIPSRIMGLFPGTIHCVFGNGDGDRFTICKFATTEFSNLKLHGEYADLEFEGKKIAVTHYPFYARALARSGEHSAVFCGHTHVASIETVGECLLVNPGEILGWKGNPSYVVYDTDKNLAELIGL